MACVSEAIGLALPGSAGAPAPYESRDAYALESGKAVMRLLADGIRPRDICTRKAFENAAIVIAATGGSTNGALHLPAMANEGGIEFDLFDVAEIFKRTPYIADLKPGGKYVAKDVYDIGGVPQILKALLEGGVLHGDCLTVTGKTLAQNLENVEFNRDQKVVYPVSNPLSPTGGVVGLKGTLAPDGAIVKVAGSKKLKFRGPARCFDCEEDAFRAVEAHDYKDGDVIVIRYEGPKGGPGMREMLSTTAALYGQGSGDKVALITDGRFSGGTRGLLHRPRRAGGRGRRTDRPHQGRRHDLDRCRERHARSRGQSRRTRTAARRLEGAGEYVSVGGTAEIRGPSRACEIRGCNPRGRKGGSALLCGHLSLF